MLTKREVFEKVKAHLLAQGRKAADDGDVCRYRSSGGLKCAAGALITDEHYSIALEGKNAHNSLVIAALAHSGVPEDAMTLVRDLQGMHDSHSYGPEEWPERLAFLERKHFGPAPEPTE